MTLNTHLNKRFPNPKKKRFVAFGATLLLLTTAGMIGGRPVFAEVITSQMRTEDARLAKSVHPLVAPRITVNALLQRLSEAEGVEIVLHVSPKGLGETEVFAVLHDTPLGDTLKMDSVLCSVTTKPAGAGPVKEPQAITVISSGPGVICHRLSMTFSSRFSQTLRRRLLRFRKL